MSDFNTIAKKWQKKWEESEIFKVKEDSKKKKYYVLEMYPYPSASFLHMGHVRNYTIGDVYARFKRMNGFNVLYPMGYDSFGLPAETAAKKEGIHPKKYTDDSIKKIMEYQKALGNSYDWSKTLSSHEPEYYRWNQFFFLKLQKKGLAYRKKAPVNWCENCQSVLANEEAESGKCWRCDSDVTKKDLEQWFFKITDYADRLLSDLKKIDWPERIKTMQKNWIGKSQGVEIFFKLENSDRILSTFTTRCDTIFSVTFIVLAPENPLAKELVKGTKYENEFNKITNIISKQSIIERTTPEGKDKLGCFLGKYAINPVNNEKIPIYIANFVLYDYGTGIVMADAHDQRDFEFARKYNIPLKFVISDDGEPINAEKASHAFLSNGILFNSGEFSGTNNMEALPMMEDWLEKNKWAKKREYFKLKDWMISRQRYWGTPIPIIYCEKCGIVPVPEKELPVMLPEKVDFKVAGNPLASNKDFLNTKCPICKGKAKRETDTMGGFVDSSWYFLRYCDNKNKEKAFDNKKVNYWMPVDQYIGGAEHAVMHLIYARFFVKALKDMGYVDFDEPFMKLFNQGIVYKDGAKMSKSKGNVVFQTDISNKYGIDTARLFLMFVSSPDKQMGWNDAGIEGSHRLINKIIRLSDNISKSSKAVEESKINKTIKIVTKSIETFDYPRAVVSIIDLLDSLPELSKKNYENLLKLISPFCPHIAEEMWEKLGNKSFISVEKWPKFDESKIDEAIEAEEDIVENIIADIKNVLELTKVEKPKKITLFIAEKWKYDFLKKLKITIERTRNVGEVIKACLDSKNQKEISQLVPKLLKNESKIPKVVVGHEKELKVLEENKKKLKEQFDCEIEIIQADNSKEQKAKQAMPNKPAIIII